MAGRQGRFDLPELAQDGLGPFIEEAAVAGQRQPSRGAVEQWRAECRSSAETWRLTAVSELGSDLAAPDRLPASTTRTKVPARRTDPIAHSSDLRNILCQTQQIFPNITIVYCGG
jgi:hypothetical protein